MTRDRVRGVVVLREPEKWVCRFVCSGRRPCQAEAGRRLVACRISNVAAPNAFGAASTAVATALCRRAGGPRNLRLDRARRLQSCVTQTESEQSRLGTARLPAFRLGALVRDSCAHTPIFASSSRNCVADDRKSPPASAASGSSGAAIVCRVWLAAIEPNWATQSHPWRKQQTDARDSALSRNDRQRHRGPVLWNRKSRRLHAL